MPETKGGGGDGRGGKGRKGKGGGRDREEDLEKKEGLFTVVVSGGVQRAHSPHFSS